MGQQRILLGVIGAADCDPGVDRLAFEVGREIGRLGHVLLCGGRGGVMSAAARGAASQGGETVGILPGKNADESPPNAHIRLPLFSGLGQARNQVLVLSAAALVAVGGGWGTLSEIALAAKHGVPVVLLESWELERPDRRREPGLLRASTPAEAVRVAIEAAARAGRLGARRGDREPQPDPAAEPSSAAP